MRARDPRESAQHATFLPQIESLRGLAALAVAYGHSALAVLFTPLPLQGADWFVGTFVFMPINWLLNGRSAVLVFFVISGLVLSLGLDKAPALGSFRAFGSFIARRGLRIFPAHLAALILFVPFAYLSLFRIPIVDPAALEASASVFRWWLDGTVYGHLNKLEWLHTAMLYNNYYNPVTWTLRVEMLGSLCMPFFAALSRRGRLGVDGGVLLLLFGMAACIDSAKTPDNFLLYLPAFYLGCMARTHGFRLSVILRAMPRTRILLLLVSLLLLLAPAAVTTGTTFALIACTSFGACGVVAIVAWGAGQRGTAAMCHPALRRLGRVSYSFYLWHDLILLAFVRLLFIVLSPEILSRHFVLVQIGTLVVTISLSLAVAFLSHAFVERPFVALGRRISSAARPTPTRTGL